MKYTPKIKDAINIMFNAHKDQYDRGGYPYVFHPFHLAEQMDTEEEIIVALLHDVVEDTDITIEDLKKYNFNQDTLDAIMTMTHDKTEDYFIYLDKVAKNKIARKVKIADLNHNKDISRLDNPSTSDLERNKKYERALEILSKNE